MKVYEPKPIPCSICKDKESIFIPLCLIDGEVKVFPVCQECQDKVPYEKIPVCTQMDKGHICVKEIPLECRPIIEKFGKNL